MGKFNQVLNLGSVLILVVIITRVAYGLLFESFLVNIRWHMITVMLLCTILFNYTCDKINWGELFGKETAKNS